MKTFNYYRNTVSMEQSHYFNQDAVDPSYFFRINGFVEKTSFSLSSAKGLFSADYFDLGTRILLKYFSFWDNDGSIRLLDMGCGYGLISSYLAAQYTKGLFPLVQSLHIDACDSSQLAIQLTQHNMQEYNYPWLSYHIQHSDILSDNYFFGKSYTTIVINPPFSAGKKVVKQFLNQAYDHLAPRGMIWVVVPTKKWAKSYIERCREAFWPLSITIQSLEAWYRVWTIEKLS